MLPFLKQQIVEEKRRKIVAGKRFVVCGWVV